MAIHRERSSKRDADQHIEKKPKNVIVGTKPQLATKRLTIRTVQRYPYPNRGGNHSEEGADHACSIHDGSFRPERLTGRVGVAAKGERLAKGALKQS